MTENPHRCLHSLSFRLPITGQASCRSESFGWSLLNDLIKSLMRPVCSILGLGKVDIHFYHALEGLKYYLRRNLKAMGVLFSQYNGGNVTFTSY